MAFGLAGSAGIHAVTFAQVIPYARTDRGGNDHRGNQQKKPPSNQHFVSTPASTDSTMAHVSGTQKPPLIVGNRRKSDRRL